MQRVARNRKRRNRRYLVLRQFGDETSVPRGFARRTSDRDDRTWRRQSCRLPVRPDTRGSRSCSARAGDHRSRGPCCRLRSARCLASARRTAVDAVACPAWYAGVIPCSFIEGGANAMPAQEYLRRILTARVYDVAIESPLELAPGLSDRLGNRVLLKREDLQPIKSFKLRGAYNKMAQLSREQLKRGVIAASAGNHAQGVALAAQKLECRALIVMPVTTPEVKVDAVRARGAEVVLFGDSYSDAYTHALEAAAQTQADVRASVRRSGRDCRAGHDRDGNPAPASSGRARADSCGVRRDRRRRFDRRCRGVHQGARAADQGDRRADDRFGCDGALARSRAPRQAARRRTVFGRHRGAGGRAAHIQAGPRPRRRHRAGRHRCDLRGDQGRVSGHALDSGTGRRAGDRRA